MNEKIIKAYYSLSLGQKAALIIILILLLVSSLVMVASATGEISLRNLTPAEGTVISIARPAVGIDVYAADNVMDGQETKMYLDNIPVTPVLKAANTPGTYNLSYLPTNNLDDGPHTVAVSVYDNSDSVAKTAQWSFNVDSGPKITQLTPGNDETENSSKINITVKDTFDDLNPDSAVLKIDGARVPASFKFAGYDWWDTCGIYQGYNITSYKDATIEFEPLTDGFHTAEFTIADVVGNVTTKTWSFTVAAKPVFSAFSPGNEQNSRNWTKISVQVFDNGSLNPASISLKVNNNIVPHSFDPATGTVTSNSTFSDGNYTVTVSAADMVGNIGTATWSFVIGNLPPQVTILSKTYNGVTYKFQDGMTVTDGVLRFNAQVIDSYDDIAPGTELRLDGQLLAASIRYEGRTVNVEIGEDEEGNPIYESYYYITSRKRVYVDYSAPLADGPHALTLSAKDVYGNAVTKRWSFTGATKPVFSEWKPVAYLNYFNPVISVKVKDNDSINQARISMTLNGHKISPFYDAVTGVISYSPAQPLANESYYTVTLSVYDVVGTGAELTWRFCINTYPDMVDSSIANCTGCHQYDDNPNFNGPYEVIHAGKLSFGGNHYTADCSKCHNYINVHAGCGQCHLNQFPSSTVKHGDTPTIMYSPVKTNITVPVRITQNREMWDCIICHQPGAGTQKRETQESTVFVQLNNHDIPELHKAPVSDCNKCHALSLTREHARPGRLDNNGQPVRCTTCHMSEDINIKNAIANNNKQCSACHLQNDHQRLHTGSLDISCQGSNCHNSALSEDHLARKDLDGNNYTCDTCHANSRQEVKRTVNANSLNCGGCHKRAASHNITLADRVPSDLPLYNGFLWSNPLEAGIFAGESAVPVTYDSGQVVVSNRRSDVTLSQVWQFYRDQLTAKGWTLKSGEPWSGGPITAEFVSGTRYVTLQASNLDYSGNAVGCRIQLWYK